MGIWKRKSKEISNSGVNRTRRAKPFSDFHNANWVRKICSLKSKEMKFEPKDHEWIQKITECPVYHPTMEEFDDPFVYLQRISPEAAKYGICKVIPPLISSTPAGTVLMKEKVGFKFTTNVQPLRCPEFSEGDRNTFLMSGRNYSLRDFEVLANKASARRYSTTGCPPSRFLEKEFWNELMNRKKGSVEYGVNVEGTAFSSSPDDPLARSKWNLMTLPKLPLCKLRLLKDAIPGITEPMLYIGMLFSMFAWHVEDHYLYSINYHHCGAPKTWYGVPGAAGSAFEKVAELYVYNHELISERGEDGTSDFLAEKTTMFPPSLLLRRGVPVFRTLQMPGEFIITFPRAYHAGFSHGFNCGEAVNFADADWFPFGAEASCRYSRLGRTPIIPYEELLCREAMLISAKNNTHISAETLSLKISFACLLRMHHCVRWCLSKLKPALSFHKKSAETIYCVLCKRDCYVAHIMCRCFPEPKCIFHGPEALSCICGRNLKLFLRENILEMEDSAKMFEQEKEVFQEVELQMKHCTELWMQNVLSSSKEVYIPYSLVNH